MKFRLLKIIILLVAVLALFSTVPIPISIASNSNIANAATLEEMLSTLDKATYGTFHSVNSYKESLDTLNQRCHADRQQIGDWTVTGTKLLHKHGGRVDNYRMLNSIIIQTEGRSNLSCQDEFQALTTLLLVDLL